MHVSQVLADLLDEQAALDEIVAGLRHDQWATRTASPRWDVTDQIAHLTFFDRAAALAIGDPDAFATAKERLWGAAGRGDTGMDEFTLAAVRALPVGERLGEWRAGRKALADAAAGLADGARVPWYGPDMGATSFLTARLMECWAHGQDVVDAVGARRPPSDRLRHIAQLGVLTRGWSYLNRGMQPPDAEIRVALSGPSGDVWGWGPEDATEVVRGGAEDFCLVVTQRRHLDDTSLQVEGPAAREWLTLAQAFAGPPTDGPVAGRFT